MTSSGAPGQRERAGALIVTKRLRILLPSENRGAQCDRADVEPWMQTGDPTGPLFDIQRLSVFQLEIVDVFFAPMAPLIHKSPGFIPRIANGEFLNTCSTLQRYLAR